MIGITLITATLVIALFTLGMGVVVLLRNPKKALFRSLFLVAAFFSFWMVANLYSNDLTLTYKSQLLVNRLVFALSAAAAGALPIFFSELTGSSFVQSRKNLIVSFTIYLAMISFSPFVVQDILPKEPITEILFGPAAVIYFLGLIFFVGISIAIFWSGAKNTTGIARTRLQVVGWATIIVLILSLVTNAVLPFWFGVFNATLVGPLTYSLMVAAFAYAIIWQRLFDVHLVIVRALAYLLVILTIGVAYILLVANATSRIFSNASQTEELLLATIVVVILIFVFQPLRRFFDQLTTRVFYREAYDVREILDQLSDSLVSQIDIDHICSSSLEILASALHPSRMQIVVLKGEKALASKAVPNSKHIKIDTTLVKAVVKRKELISHTEETANRSLKKLRSKFGVDLALKLVTQKDVEGLLLLGPKANGLVYNSKDFELLSISAKSIGLALANAKRYDEISRFNETLLTKIESATKRLRKANVRLKRLDSAKSDFISAASHQLKPQLTAAKGFVDVIYDGVEGPLNRQQRATLELVTRSVDRMIRIVSDILENAVNDPENLSLHMSTTNVTSLVKEEVNNQRENIIKHGLTIEYKVEEGIVDLLVDKLMIQEVLSNLLNNAIQYSTDGGYIEVSARTVGDRMEFTVSDSGIGIGTSAKKDLFNKFARGARAKSVRPTGTGLGLYVSKTLVEAHGGGISIEPRKPTGTKAIFWLPLT